MGLYAAKIASFPGTASLQATKAGRRPGNEATANAAQKKNTNAISTILMLIITCVKRKLTSDIENLVLGSTFDVCLSVSVSLDML